ncbi:MAG: nicotinamide riboside transporter PnuC [Bacteroidetes bacterium]|nr:MAG: nicotinamide riboside transporter PnuC [Bacteroidota bacterium]
MLDQLLSAFANTPWTEWVAFFTSIIYVWLASRKSSWCWPFAIISSGIYILLCFQSKLYADSALQSFYVLMAVWAWGNWGKEGSSIKLIVQWPYQKHLINIAICLLVTLLIGFILDTYTDQALPYTDAFIFCFSLSATYLIGKKVLENWIYFIIIDLIAIPLFWNRELYVTSLLYLCYTIIALDAWRKWRKDFQTTRL